MRFCLQIACLVLALVLSAPPSLFAASNADDPAIRRLLADASDIGLTVGSLAPDIRLKDQTGRDRDRASLSGPNGLVLVFFRSADW